MVTERSKEKPGHSEALAKRRLAETVDMPVIDDEDAKLHETKASLSAGIKRIGLKSSSDEGTMAMHSLPLGSFDEKFNTLNNVRFDKYFNARKSARDLYTTYLEIKEAIPEQADRFWAESVNYLERLILHNFSPEVLNLQKDLNTDEDINKLSQTFNLAWHKCLTPDLRRLVMDQAFALAKQYPRDKVLYIFTGSFNASSNKKTKPLESMTKFFYEEEIPYPENPHNFPFYHEIKPLINELKGIAYDPAQKEFSEIAERLQAFIEYMKQLTFIDSAEPMAWEQFKMLCLVEVGKIRGIKTELERIKIEFFGKKKKEAEREKLKDIADKIERDLVGPQLVTVAEVIYSEALSMPYAA